MIGLSSTETINRLIDNLQNNEIKTFVIAYDLEVFLQKDEMNQFSLNGDLS